MDAMRAAKKLGYRVVTTDNVPSNPGHNLADVNYYVDTTNKEAVLEIALRESIDGVLAPATDVAVPTAAYIAENMGLKGPPFESADIACDKIMFKDFLRRNGFPVHHSAFVLEDNSPPAGVFENGPCIIKPDRSSGCKGVFIVTSKEELQLRLPEALSFSPARKVVLEKFIAGFQGTVEGVLEKGDLALTFFLDRKTFVPPYVTTCGHHVPTRLSKTIQRRVKEQLHELVHLLKLEQGPFDCDFVVTDDEVFLLEISPRIGGNSIPRLISHAAGFEITEYAVKSACGDPVELPVRLHLKPTALVLLGVPSGGAFHYDEAALQALRIEEWVETLLLDIPMGHSVEPFKNGRHRVGEALLRGKDLDDLPSRVSELLSRLALQAVSHD